MGQYDRTDVNLFGVISFYRWQRQFAWVVSEAVVVRVLIPDFGIHIVASVRFVFRWPLDTGGALYRMISHDEIDDRSMGGCEHDLLAKLYRLIIDRNLMILEHNGIVAVADKRVSF